jgi:N-acetylglucosaminyldiphosphoundecaprenol N-acetyl-beta-D-mannosaminyltransferase
MAFQTIHQSAQKSSANEDDVLLLDRRQSARNHRFLGVDFVSMTLQALVRRLSEGSSTDQSFRYICTPNVDHMVRSAQNPDAPELYGHAWLNVNDSKILEVLAQFSGLDLPACPGSDLSALLLASIIDPSEPVVIIGCSQKVVERVTEIYGLKDVRWYEPPMGLRTNPSAIQAVAAFCVANPARFHFLCVGSPQQEMVAKAVKEMGGGRGIGLCVGASLEFLAGTRKRAPLFMQKARLEWLYRLLSEPKVMWRRYLVEGPKIFGIWLKWEQDRRAAN